jgi:nitrite reductase/ring-hydroxylating ferredoxin subunit
MTRYEFLKKAGFAGGSLFALLSCVKNEDSYIEALVQNPDGSTSSNSTGTSTNNTGGTGTENNTGSTKTQADSSVFISTEKLNALSAKIKLDLTSTSNSKLLVKGGYYVLNNTYVIALSKTGKYVAATVTCTHEPKKRVIFSNEEWYCTDHGARFSLTGVGLNSKGSKGLTIYKTATDGKTLIIY